MIRMLTRPRTPQQKITEYPLIVKSRISPPFRQTLLAFFDSLVETMHASSTLYHDVALMENIQAWITTMSSSASRPFRHTATVISLSFVSTLCDVALEVAEADAKTLRQLEGERKKGRVNAARVASLEEKVEQGNQKREIVEGTIRDIFDTVFVHRYRDVDPRIRAECVQALGHWILTLPDVFFEGKYLRYLGWILSDTSAPTRLEVIRQLQRLFKKTTNIAGLHTFTDRFRPRLVEMAVRDADSGVRAATVELLEQLRAAQLLQPDDMDEVSDLVFDSDPRVRKALVPFFTEHVESLYEGKLEDLGGEDLLDGALANDDDEDYDHPRLTWLKLNCLAQLLCYSDPDERKSDPLRTRPGPAGTKDVLVAAGAQSRISLAADTLCEHFAELREWEILAGYLLYDHSEAAEPDGDPESRFKEECKPDEAFETILLEVLYAAVRHSLTRSDDADGHARRGKKKRANKAESAEDQENIARHLAELIPRFLNKFGARPATASVVLKLGRLLDLDIFQQLRQDSTTYASLLDDINKQFLTHADQSVLVEASAALLHAKTFEELEEVTDEKVHQLWDDTINTLQALIQGRDPSVRASFNRNVLSGLVSTVRRISNLASISDCVETFEAVPAAASKKRQKGAVVVGDTLQTLIHILGRSAAEPGPGSDEGIEELERELAVCVMKSAFLYFMWRIRTLKQQLSDEAKHVDVHEVSTLIQRRQAFSLKLLAIITTRTGMDELRLTATGMFLDLHTLFSTLRQIKPAVASLPDGFEDADTFFASTIREIPPAEQTAITSVFTAAERIYAKKTRRALEVGHDDEPVDSDDDDDEADDEDEDEDAEAAQRARHSQALIYEQRFCELVGKMVLAIIAKVLDASGPQKGKLRERLERNRSRLGQNYKEVVAYLEEPKAKKSKKKAVLGRKEPAKPISEEVVADDDEDEPMEEGGELDLRGKELTAEDHEIESVEGEAGEVAAAAHVDEIEDEIMGD